ncbi:hypothetical protein PLESTB_000185400 [Pleodorina starrii]|uniref:Uncharacterized protein n=1 Tax=Pleodorina starrii TaxID=330485 RepID=A0A9W6BBM4_9CHLO|nr:hypothetical protein PLESTB_000185400 [Pleodorina starrii]
MRASIILQYRCTWNSEARSPTVSTVPDRRRPTRARAQRCEALRSKRRRRPAAPLVAQPVNAPGSQLYV